MKSVNYISTNSIVIGNACSDDPNVDPVDGAGTILLDMLLIFIEFWAIMGFKMLLGLSVNCYISLMEGDEDQEF